MSLSFSRFLGLAGSGLATAAFALPLAALAQDEPKQDEPKRELVIERVVLEGEGENVVPLALKVAEPPFWIGVALDGPGGPEGLKIAEVFPDSPARKAELKPGDVLIAVGDKK